VDSASERIALARALHDGIAQDLVALRFRIEFLADGSALNQEGSRELKRISLEISHLTEKVRQELFNLRHPVSGDFRAIYEKRIAKYQKQIPINFICTVDSLPAPLSHLFMQITEELVRNTLAHAGASEIDISIAQLENSIQFLFSDDGSGGAHEGGNRYGLTGIRESVELCGGSFTISDKGGTEICLNFSQEGFSS
jgi:signal transduction histidine kinase